MCGIAVLYHYHSVASGIDRQELLRMRDYMEVRGPDGAGLWVSPDERIGMAHRRLSIIDLSEAALQPMQSQDGRFVISYNGEIYNYRVLRKQLELKGYVFHSDSDTEVLLAMFAEYGEAMLDQLRGMFAISIWDSKERKLFLARDPYGIKPLYYADDGWIIRIASQVKALLVSGRVSRDPEPAGIAGFYLFGSVPEPFTCYQEVRAVPAGHYLWVTGSGAETPERYFSVCQVFAEAERYTAGPKTLCEAEEWVREALLDTVQHHFVADVPVGAFLSAGIDSCSVVALAKECGYDNLETVTLGFSEFAGKPQDEPPLAEKAAGYYQTRHTTRRMDAQEFYKDLPRILERMDQPSIDGVNTWFVSKAAAEMGWKVALSGVGGDELFGGYPSFSDIPTWVQAMRFPSRIPGLGGLFSRLAPCLPRLPPKARGLVKYGGSYSGAYLLKRGLFLPEELPHIMGREAAIEGLQRLHWRAWIHSHLDPLPASSFAKVSSLESSIYMRNQLLRDADWAGMAHSLEIRTPLVDAHLLKRLAPVLVSRYKGKGKSMLAAAPSNPLPDAIRHRPKTGFSIPVDQWLHQARDLDAWRSKPLLTRKQCPWVRRWSVTIAAHFGVEP